MRILLAASILVLAACAAPSRAPEGSAPATSPQAQAESGGYDAELTTYAYPFPVAFHALTSQGRALRMAYLDVRPESPNGRAVLLLHGKNFNAAYWEPTIRALTARGFRVIAPDQVGFGKSSKPDAYQFSFDALAANTRSLLTSLGVARVAVVGHSMGGMLATRFALAYPDATERLVLVNPIGLEDYRDAVPYRAVDDLYADELAQTPEKIRAYQRKNYYAGQWKPEYEKLIEPLAGWTRGPDKARVAWNAALTSDMIFTQPVVHDLPRVRVPALLVIGQRDRTALGKDRAPPDAAARLGDYPALGKQAARSMPNAQLIEIADAGHLPQVEAFDAYRDALVRFLEAQPVTTPR